MNTSPENHPSLIEDQEKVAEEIMETIIDYVDTHTLTAQEMDKAFSMVMTEDSSEEGLRPEVVELRDLMADIKTNQYLNDSVRSYIQIAYLDENSGTTLI